MKVRILIALSKELLEAVDKYAAQQRKTRSDFIEAALRPFVKRHAQNAEWNARDLEIINRKADSMNQEALDVLEYSLR